MQTTDFFVYVFSPLFQIPLPSAHIHLSVVTPGRLDAIATYFDLHLDPESSFTTSPIDNVCSSWEQAIFPVVWGGEGGRGGGVWVEKGDAVLLCASCSETFLVMNVEGVARGRRGGERGGGGGGEERGGGGGGERRGEGGGERGGGGGGERGGGGGGERGGVSGDNRMDVQARGATERENLPGAHFITKEYRTSQSFDHFVDRAALSRLNDTAYVEMYSAAILEALNAMETMESGTDSSSVSSLDSGMANMELGTATVEPGHNGGGECWNGMETEASGIENEHESTWEREEEEEGEEEEEEEEDLANCIVLDMSHEFSILGLMALKLGENTLLCYT